MDNALKEKLWQILRENAPESVAWTHYDLAEQTEVTDVETWREFISEPDVADWLKTEQNLLQKYELSKLVQGIAGSHSVGQAQLISAVAKINEANKNNNTKGPIFIYTYVPLNKEQANAPNVQMLEEDIFLDKTKEINTDTKPEDDTLPEYEF